MSDKDFGSSPDLAVKINKLLICVGSLALAYSAISAVLQSYTLKFFITHPSVYILFFATLLLLAGQFFRQKALPYLHIFILAVTAVLSILSDYNQFYGIGQVIMLMLLLYKYGFLDRHIRKKLIFLSLSFIATVEISLYNSRLAGLGIEVFLYVAYFIFFLYLMYKSEIDEVIARSDREHNRDLTELEREKARISNQLEKYKEKLSEVNRAIELEVRSEKGISLEDAGLTKTERRIVSLLVARNLSNKDIAQHLGVKERTVKTHMYNIFNKTGVGSRTELIGKFYSLDERERDWDVE